MNELKTLSNEQLLLSTDKAVDFEKAAITNTTRHFQEIYERRAYLPAYANMFDFLTKKYGYCNGSAQLRIGTIRLIREVPIAQAKIESGELSMTAAANIQTFLNSEKSANKPYSVNAKIELVEACLGKSTREVQKEFVRRNPEIEKRESVRYTSEERVRIDISISDATLKSLNELRDLLSHVDPNMSLGSLIERLAEDGMNKYSPQRKAERARRRAERNVLEIEVLAEQTARAATFSEVAPTVGDSELLHAHEVTPASADRFDGSERYHEQNGRKDLGGGSKRTRYIIASEKHKVAFSKNGCNFIDGKTGHRCGSTKFLQLDHVEPFANGGTNTAENLRWLCGVHNRWRHEQRH